MEPSTTSYVCLAVGVLLTALAVWERLGRGPTARAWAGSSGEFGVRVSLFVLPGIGLCALALGITPWADGPVAGLLLLVLIVVGLMSLLGWGLMRLPYPRWTVPGWARETIAVPYDKKGRLR